MLVQSVARPLALNDDGVVQQPVEQSRAHDGIDEHLTPLRRAAVSGQDRRAFLVARGDEIKNRLPPLGTTDR